MQMLDFKMIEKHPYSIPSCVGFNAVKLKLIVLFFWPCKDMPNKRIYKGRNSDLIGGCLRHILFNFVP